MDYYASPNLGKRLTTFKALLVTKQVINEMQQEMVGWIWQSI